VERQRRLGEESRARRRQRTGRPQGSPLHLGSIAWDAVGAPVGTIGMVGTGDALEMEYASTSRLGMAGFGESLAGSCADAGNGGVMSPYDLLVISSLVRFAHYFPATRLWSDGEEEAITMGLTICRKVFDENSMPLLEEEELFPE
jgi:hypothetical protein